MDSRLGQEAFNKDGQCTLNSDPDDMKNFMENVLRLSTIKLERWLPDAKSSMTVTHLECSYFSGSGIERNNYWICAHKTVA